MKAIYLNENPGTVNAVYPEAVRERLGAAAGAGDGVYSKARTLEDPERFARTEYIFSTWGMPAYTEEEIKAVFPCLKAVFYAAGSVQGFALP